MYRVATVLFLLLFLECEAQKTIATVFIVLISANKGKGLRGYMKYSLLFENIALQHAYSFLASRWC